MLVAMHDEPVLRKSTLKYTITYKFKYF